MSVCQNQMPCHIATTLNRGWSSGGGAEGPCPPPPAGAKCPRIWAKCPPNLGKMPPFAPKCPTNLGKMPSICHQSVPVSFPLGCQSPQTNSRSESVGSWLGLGCAPAPIFWISPCDIVYNAEDSSMLLHMDLNELLPIQPCSVRTLPFLMH